jgi:hypothetical protein
MICRQPARLAVIVGAALLLAAAAAVEAGPRPGGRHGLRRSSHFHQRLYQARRDLYCRGVGAAGRHLGVRRHHGLGHGGYGPARGVRRFHGLGDGYLVASDPWRCWNAVRPYYVVPYPYGYGNDGWITVGAPEYHRTSAPPVFAVVSTQRAATAPAEPEPAPSDAAWGLLARGEARAALSAFATLALRNMRDAEARVGYGLAASMLGKDNTAAWAYRRAVDTKADVLDDLARDERLPEPLRKRLRDLADRIEGSAADTMSA